jgi:putative NADH-flavin reductase
MKVVIFGASGRVGSLLVAEMLRRNHEVTAFIFGPNPFKDDDRLIVLSGDIHSNKDVLEAIKSQDAVMSALGSWGTNSKDILSSAIENIIPAMESEKIKRIVTLTGADARDKYDKPSLLQKLTRNLLSAMNPKIMRDGEDHIKYLRASKLDWTVLRSPVMTDSGMYGNYKLRMTLPHFWQTINRKDVCLAMCDLVESKAHLKQSPVIYRV